MCHGVTQRLEIKEKCAKQVAISAVLFAKFFREGKSVKTSSY